MIRATPGAAPEVAAVIQRMEIFTLVSILVWSPLFGGCVSLGSGDSSRPEDIAWIADCSDVYVVVKQRSYIHVAGRGRVHLIKTRRPGPLPLPPPPAIPEIDECIGRALERHLQAALPGQNVRYVGFLPYGGSGGSPESAALCQLHYGLTLRGNQLGVQESMPFFYCMPPDPLDFSWRMKDWWRAGPGDGARHRWPDKWEYAIDATGTLTAEGDFQWDQGELNSAIAQWADRRGADLARQVAEALKSCGDRKRGDK